MTLLTLLASCLPKLSPAEGPRASPEGCLAAMCPVQLGTKGNSLQNLLKVTSLQQCPRREGIGQRTQACPLTRPWFQFSSPQSQELVVGDGFSLALLTCPGSPLEPKVMDWG